MKKLLLILTLVFTTSSFSQIINIPADQPTIQAGIDIAVDGETVLVAEGTYFENINFKGKAVTVASRFILDQDTSRISKTIIDGSKPSHPDTGSVVIFNSGEDTTSVLSGFTITGGSGTGTEYVLGGGILLYNSGAYICNNIIEQNVIDAKNNKAAGGGICCHNETPDERFTIIDSNTIVYNKALSKAHSGSSGGGVDVWGSSIKITNNIVKHNEVGGGDYCFGPGIRIALSIDKSTIENNIISYNKFRNSQSYSGGLFLLQTQGVKVSKNHFEGNSGTWGAGICDYQSCNNIISNNSFINNIAQQDGGGIYIQQSNSIINNNKFINNYADSTGGGIYFCKESNAEFKNNLVAYNKAGVGGGIAVIDNSNPGIINNTIVENTSRVGGAIAFLSNSSPLIMNTIIYGNIANSRGNQIWFGDTVSHPTFTYCNIEDGVNGFGFNLENSSYAGIYNHNLEIDPLFVKGDSLFNLSANNTCVGNGTVSIDIDGTTYNCPATDFYGNTRPNPIDIHVDIGAIESSFPWNDPTSVSDDTDEISEQFRLFQNYPNPFNPSTIIKYEIPIDVKRETKDGVIPSGVEGGFVTLKIYDILGREVITLVNQKQKPGHYEVDWNAGEQPSGVYFYQLTTGNYVETRKMILLR